MSTPVLASAYSCKCALHLSSEAVLMTVSFWQSCRYCVSSLNCAVRMLEKSWVSEPSLCCWQCLLSWSTCRERERRYSGVRSKVLREYSSILIDCYLNRMVRTAMIRLMTWNRRHFRLFPFGSSIYPLILTLLIIETPSLLLTADLFYRQFYPHLLVPLLFLLQLLTLYALFRCVYTDPGIIPQIVDKYEWDEEHALIPSVNHLNIPEHKYVMASGGLNVYQKYCIQCCIYRPLRTIHCQVCNHCVERYDHHCPWLGVCIGKFNYRFFFMFLVTLFALAAAVAAIAATMVFTILSSQPLHNYVLEIIIAVTAGVFSLPVLKLLTYHIGLICSRQTTNEDLKELYRLLNSPVPFEGCDAPSRPPMAPLKASLLLSTGMDEKRSAFNDDCLQKGKRYSTLVSDRQSVLNYLVENEL